MTVTPLNSKYHFIDTPRRTWYSRLPAKSCKNGE